MYDRPELQKANDALWQAIRSEIGHGPQALTRDADLWDIWENPLLLVGQTCSLPYRMRLHDQVQLVGCFDHKLPGCAPGFYNSVLIARRDDPRDLSTLLRDRVAINQRHSQSGYAALLETAQAHNILLKVAVETGGHQASAKAVAEGHADVAALDALSWHFMKRFDSFTGNLREVTRTAPTPALPLICAIGSPVQKIRFAISRAIKALEPSLQDTLRVYDLISHPQSAYTSLPIWADFSPN